MPIITRVCAAAGALLLAVLPATAAPSRDPAGPTPAVCAWRAAAIGTDFSQTVRPSRRIARTTVWAIVTSLDLDARAIVTPPRVISRRAAIAARENGC